MIGWTGAAGALAASGCGALAGYLADRMSCLIEPVPAVSSQVLPVPRPLAAPVAGAAAGAAAIVFAPTAAAAGAVAAIAWLLLAIAVCDEHTLQIPHVLWATGMVAGLTLAWAAEGWPALSERLAAVAVTEAVLLGCAAVARRIRKRPAVGGGDYGVVGFIASVCGSSLTVDVLLAAALIALAWTVSDVQRRSSRAPSPFGACLVLATLCVLLPSLVTPLPGCPGVGDDIVLRHLLMD